MKDQVDALQASGIAATFLNSSLAAEESRKRLRGLHNGEYRLLYAAPERLMLSGFLEDLQRWNVKLIAVDEAHCISEWGHDFRPEYRQISQLRELFPNVPFMALTATATERVRADIVTHLKLHEPRVYVASFNRPTSRIASSAKTNLTTSCCNISKRAQKRVALFIASRAKRRSARQRISPRTA